MKPETTALEAQWSIEKTTLETQWGETQPEWIRVRLGELKLLMAPGRPRRPW